MTDSTPDRRTRILDAALACMLEKGYRATSIGEIRARSGASTGSIYHFFGGKAGLALALVERAVAGWSAAGQVALDPDADMEAATRASIAGLVRWGTANRGLFRFFDEIRSLGASEPELAAIWERLEEGQLAARQRYAAALAAGLVRDLPWPVAHSLMVGPAYNYLRLVAGGHPPDARAAAQLASAAWEAVRAADRPPMAP